MVEEVGRHITFRYEGVLPLADQDLLALLDILVNKADIMQVPGIYFTMYWAFRSY